MLSFAVFASPLSLQMYQRQRYTDVVVFHDVLYESRVLCSLLLGVFGSHIYILHNTYT
jgi:hypothetical protein